MSEELPGEEFPGDEWRPPGSTTKSICKNCGQIRGRHRSGGGYCFYGPASYIEPDSTQFDMGPIYGPYYPRTAEEMYEALTRGS